MIMEFKLLTINDIEMLKSYYNKYNNQCADYTACGYFLWRDYFKTKYAIVGDCLILKMDSKIFVNFYSMPLGENIENAIYELKKYCADNNETLKFFPVPEADIEKIKKYIDVDIKFMDRCSDYIYDYNSLKSLSGRKLHGQKNHLNYFIKNNTGVKVKKVDKDDINTLNQFLEKLYQTEKIDSDFHNQEFMMTKEMLINFDKYNFDCYMLSVNDNVIGFIVGEMIKNTIFIHFQKMDRTYRGSYQYLMVEYLNTYENAEYVNMEDDAEDDDLKYTKECYHPIYMLDKYMLLAK